jgi:hypothetical protein
VKKIILIASGLMLSTQVYAKPPKSCTQADLNGNYVMYQNSVAAANLHTGRCEINIQNGQATGTCAFSVTSNGAVVPGFSGPVSGPATMNSNCSADLQLDFSPAPTVVVKSFFDLQFTPDKQSYIGQWSNNFGLLGTSAGTRYSTRLPSTIAPMGQQYDDD